MDKVISGCKEWALIIGKNGDTVAGFTAGGSGDDLRADGVRKREVWRKLTGSHLVVLMAAGAEFVNGELAERSKRERDAA